MRADERTILDYKYGNEDFDAEPSIKTTPTHARFLSLTLDAY